MCGFLQSCFRTDPAQECQSGFSRLLFSSTISTVVLIVSQVCWKVSWCNRNFRITWWWGRNSRFKAGPSECIQRQRCGNNLTQNRPIFLFFLNFSPRLKVALPRFPHRASLWEAFFRKPHWSLVNMTSDPSVTACVGNESDFEALRAPQTGATHPPLQSAAS